jgi:UPF0755 protein
MDRRRIKLLAVGAVLGVVVVAYLAYQAAAPYRSSSQPVFVVIERFTPASQIARQLHDAGVIRSERMFLALHYLPPGRTLKAGEYEFDRPLSARQVLQKLQRGEVYYHTVTVPEGFNIFEISSAMAATELVSREEALEALEDPGLVQGLDPLARTVEGYAFPDTYRFTRPTTARAMVAAMVARFRAVYGEMAARYRPSRPIHDIVTMASLVEKETGTPAERPLVAGVFYNRLRAGMRLQCDPSVIYAALRTGRYRGSIFRSDLQFTSPYNTYTHAGLPPGPIASPGRASLQAALAPASTRYMYFVSNGQNGHRFSATLQEHSRNVATYRKGK